MAIELKRLRLERNWSQAEMARRAGIARFCVQRFERGLHLPTWRTLKRWMRALGIKEIYI